MLYQILEEHRGYLADTNRLRAYGRALEELVRPGSVVLDVGSGTGLLGLMACRAGARKVYSVDRGSIIELAREIARQNGFGDRMTFVQGMSTEITLPERADLAVADQVGFLGHEAGLIAFFADARSRHLRPDGALVPSALELFLAPVESPAAWDKVSFWGSRHDGLDFRPVRTRAENACFLVKLDPAGLLADGAPCGTIDLGVAAPHRFDVGCEIEIGRSGILHGIGGWCRARLSPGSSMTNAPDDRDAIDRPQAFFPVSRPQEVAAGDRVRVRMRIHPVDLVSWSVVLTRTRRTRSRRGEEAAIRFDHSTFKGMLVSREEIESGRPDHTPVLSPSGRARLDVLSLCDGTMTIAGIESEIRRRHPELLSTPAEAAAFVSRIVGRSCTR